MDIQALKIELVKEILSSESKEFLDKLYTAIKSNNTDFWLELSAEERVEIRISREQIKEGKSEDWTDVFDRLSRKSV